jgi:hypothetical protein
VTLEAHRARFAVPGVVEIEADPRGLVRVRVTTPEAEGRAHLHGAHTTYDQARGRRRSSS